MPLYEYECSACGRRREVLQKFSDDPLTVCSFCGGVVDRLISSSAIQFKGTGWYVTDYARKPVTSSKENGKEKASDEKAPAAAATDSKPNPKASESSTPSAASE